MMKKLITLLTVLLLASACSSQVNQTPITVVSGTIDIKDLYLKHPVKAPKERSYKEFMKILNVAMFKECIMTQYLNIPVPPYCKTK